MRPVERLEMKRTGSIASRFGPAVTSTRSPRRSCALQHALDLGDDDRRFRQAARPFVAAGERADAGFDHVPAVAPQPRQVLLHDRVLPHVHVHRRRQQHRRARRQQHRGEQVVADAGRRLADQVRRRRRDDDRVGVVGEADVADLGLLGEVEQLGRHRLAGQRLQGERGDELGGRARHDDAHAGPAGAQQAHQLGEPCSTRCRRSGRRRRACPQAVRTFSARPPRPRAS